MRQTVLILFIAQSLQQSFRMNCFADGVGVLLGALLTAIGLHGLCTLPTKRQAGA
jgi:hypothetical protein